MLKILNSIIKFTILVIDHAVLIVVLPLCLFGLLLAIPWILRQRRIWNHSAKGSRKVLILRGLTLEKVKKRGFELLLPYRNPSIRWIGFLDPSNNLKTEIKVADDLYIITFKSPKIIGFLVGGILLFVSVFIISNTVRLTFINRKDEVEIMRLVGANRWFIKTPFLIEGLLNGFLGGVISVGLLYMLYQGVKYKLSPYLLDAIGMIRISFIPFSVIMFLIALGMGVGGVGSLFSLRL